MGAQLPAELIGAFCLVLGGCGSAVVAGAFPELGIGFTGVILGVTHQRAPKTGFAGVAIGLALTLIHLISIPVTNTSVNPPLSTAPAL